MDQEITTQHEIEQDLGFKSDMPLTADADVRLLRLYDEIAIQDDPAMMLTLLLSGVHYYGQATRLSNEVNDRQGKNRVVYTASQYKLMEYIDEDNLTIVQDTRARDLLVFALNTYLSNKQTLPTKQSEAKLIVNNVKSLYMILICQGLFEVISRLENTPSYVKDVVDTTLQSIEEERVEIVNEWIDYLKRTESENIYRIAEDLGESVWSNLTSSVGNVFNTIFKSVITEFKDYSGARSAYIEFRDRFKKVTYNFELKKLYDKFDMTKSIFQGSRTRLMNELSILLQNDQDINALSLLIYGSTE